MNADYPVERDDPAYGMEGISSRDLEAMRGEATILVAFIVLRSSREPVTDPAEAEPVLQALLGPLDGLARMVESDSIGGWLTEASEDEAARLRIHGSWVAGGDVDGLDYVAAAEWSG